MAGLFKTFISRDSDIQQSDLAALSDDDLQRFGFKEASVRSLMLSEFPNSANQTLHYDKFVKFILFSIQLCHGM